jgi:hypothetical protein
VWAFLLLNQRSKDRFTSINDLWRTVEREDSLFRVKKEDFFKVLVDKPKIRLWKHNEDTIYPRTDM